MEDLIERINALEYEIAALTHNNQNCLSMIEGLQKTVEDLDADLNRVYECIPIP